MADPQPESSGLTDEAAFSCCSDADPSTKDFLLQQTMLRIKDPKKSLDFYTRILGMTLLQKLDFPTMKFSLYFLAYEDKNDIPKDADEKVAWVFSRKATLELTHYIFTPFVAIGALKMMRPRVTTVAIQTLEDLVTLELLFLTYMVLVKIQELGVKFVKKPDDGKMKGLAFIQDPDGYWIEILNPNKMININF